MAYIDQTYYDNTYLGVAMPADTFLRLSERATDIINQMTNYQFTDLSALDTFSRDQVKKATAAQTEYLFTQGESLNHSGGNITSAKIGNYSFDEGNGANENLSRDAQRTSPAVIEYLTPTGLLYSGVDCS